MSRHAEDTARQLRAAGTVAEDVLTVVLGLVGDDIVATATTFTMSKHCPIFDPAALVAEDVAVS